MNTWRDLPRLERKLAASPFYEQLLDEVEDIFPMGQQTRWGLTKWLIAAKHCGVIDGEQLQRLLEFSATIVSANIRNEGERSGI